MSAKVLEVNVDDQNNGGVFSLVKNVILNNESNVIIDIAALEKFERKSNIELLEEHDCTIHYVGFTGNKLLKQLIIYKKIKKLLEEKHYDYVHIHSDVAYKMIASGLAAKNARIENILLHSHSSGVDGNKRIMKKMLHMAARPFLKNVGTKYIACSDYAAEWMFRTTKDIEIINNGVSLSKFKFDPNIRKEVREEYNVGNKLVVGHVGRFLYQKNHDFIIDIADGLKKGKINAVIFLVGEGEEKKRIEMLAEQKDVKEWVVFCGISDRVNDLMQAMDVFILPSFFEGLPIVGIEAQAAGLPCLFSDRISSTSKITDSVQFLPINRGDVDRWINAITEIRAKAKSSRNEAYLELKEKKFDISDTVEQFLNLYS